MGGTVRLILAGVVTGGMVFHCFMCGHGRDYCTFSRSVDVRYRDISLRFFSVQQFISFQVTSLSRTSCLTIIQLMLSLKVLIVVAQFVVRRCVILKTPLGHAVHPLLFHVPFAAMQCKMIFKDEISSFSSLSIGFVEW